MLIHNIRRIILLISFLFILTPLLKAQDSIVYKHDLFTLLSEKSQGQGDINLVQDAELYVLIDKYSRINKRDGLSGYRIQIFSGSGQNAREQANQASQLFCKNFPDFDPNLIYMEYQAPYFKLRIGDFRNKTEANAFYHSVKVIFPDSYLVKSKINFPKLSPVTKNE